MRLKSKTFRVFLLSYTLVFVLPCLGLAGVLMHLSARVEDDIRVNNWLRLEQLKSGVDLQIHSVMQFSGKLISDPVTIDFSSNPEVFSDLSGSYETLRAFVDELSRISATNTAIRRAYLYSVRDDKVLSTKGLLDSAAYYHSALEKDGYSYQDWAGYLRQATHTRFVNFRSEGSAPGEGVNYVVHLSYSRSLPVLLILEINPDPLVAQLEMLARQESYVAVVYEGENRILSNHPLFDSLSPGQLPLDREGGYLSARCGDLMVGSLYSPLTGCAYYMATPYHAYARQLVLLRNGSLAVFALVLFGGVALILLVSGRIYRPIDRILEALRQRGGTPPEEADGFAYIESVIDRMMEEKLSYETQLYRQSQMVCDALVARLFYRQADCQAVERGLAQAGVALQGEGFYVALLWSEEYFSPDYEEAKLTQFVVRNVFTELFSRAQSAYAVLVEGRTALLVGAGPQALEPLLEEWVAQGREFIRHHFGVQVYAALSGRCDSLQTAWQGYQEAEWLSMHVEGQQPALYMWRRRRQAPSMFQQPPQELEEKLCNLLLLGEGPEAGQLLRGELARAGRMLRGWQWEVYLAGLYQMLMQAARLLDLSVDQLASIQQSLCQYGGDRLTGEALLLLAQRLCELAGAREQKRRSSGVELRVRQYVAAHYADPELTVSEIADKLDLNVNYLTSLYKKKTGRSIQEVIGEYRMAQAKHLLESSEKRVEEVALLCGYYNSPSFIRAFKRAEGVTPGQYRLLHHGASAGLTK